MAVNTAANSQNRAKKSSQSVRTRKMVQVAMLAAVATVLMLFDFPIPFLAPPFYKMDFSEIPVLIGAFAMGPLAGAAIEGIKILINLVVNGTSTAFVGEAANLVMGCALVVPAGWLYKRHKTKKQAFAGLAAGTVCMTVSAVLINAYILLPAYSAAFGMPIDQIVSMGAAVNGAVDSLLKFCVLIVAPFNLAKAVAVSVLTLVLYKHISRLLKADL